jgi:hypothetical protein
MPDNCAKCGAAYSVEPEERDWIAEQHKESPSMCPRCRAFTDGLQDESIACTVCGKVFIFPRELRLFARLFRWPRPRRCIGGCRTHKEPFTEEEDRLNDFLRRIRSARGLGAGPTGRMHAQAIGLSRRISDGSSRTRKSSSPLPADVGGSLAQALKEFQDKKRRR